MFEFKRQIQSGTIAEYSIDQAKFNFLSKTLEKCTHGSIPTSYRPYVSLITELGVQLKAPEEVIIYKPDRSSSKKKSEGHPQTPPPIEGGSDHATPSKIYISPYGQRHHPKRDIRVCIWLLPDSDRGIDAAHKASYALLLSSRDCLGEHPRKDAQKFKAVRRTKPCWNRGDDCYHWVKHDDILHGPLGWNFSLGIKSSLMLKHCDSNVFYTLLLLLGNPPDLPPFRNESVQGSSGHHLPRQF